MISVVIPARNEERLLPGCLESLRDQDYAGAYEVIVADNGSVDSTASIARSAGARVISLDATDGVFRARRVGADAARGDIIVQADSDTIYPRGWLKRIAEQFEAHPEAVAVAGRFFYRDPVRWARVEYWLRHGLNRVSAAISGRPLFIAGATLAFRRSAFLAVNGYNGLIHSPDQYGIAGRLSRVGKVLYDRHLCVLTSSRSVQKPFIQITRDILLNLPRWSLYLGTYWLGIVLGLARRGPGKKAG